MIQKNKVKTIWFCCLVIVIVYLAAGCSDEKKKDNKDCCLEPYANYDSFVSTIFEQFEADGFIDVSEGKNLYYSVSIPENSYFTDRNDLYENNPLQPQNWKDIFIDEDNSVLVWMSCLFSEDHLEKKFVTIDEFPAEYESEQLKKIYPFLSETYECVLKENHCIVLLKFYPLGQMETDDKVENFRGKVVSFIQNYCAFLDTYYG